MIIILMFITGLVFGSFYAVVGSRGAEGKSIIKPRSHCEHCGHTLKWYELIPVLSYIIQRGKCRSCHTKLSIFYPIIELLCGCLFALAFLLFGFGYEFWTMLIISSLLIIIFVSDFKYKVILDIPLIISGVFILLLKYYCFGVYTFGKSFLSGLLMFGLFLLIKFIGDKLFKTESLGGGDIKLSFIIGTTLGIRLSLVSLVLASLFALPYALYYQNNMDKEVPFGPFLISSLLIVFMFMPYFVNLLNFLY